MSLLKELHCLFQWTGSGVACTTPGSLRLGPSFLINIVIGLVNSFFVFLKMTDDNGDITSRRYNDIRPSGP